MKRPLVKLAVALLLVAVAASTAGGTYATWSDSETSVENSIETCALDLKVNGQDDGPWGAGVAPIFSITGGECGVPYQRTVGLYNAADCDCDGEAYVHVKNVAGCLADDLLVWLYYDGVLKVDGQTLSSLECNEILLGDLDAGDVKYLTVEIQAESCCEVPTTWDFEFQLIGPCGFGDTETASNSFDCTCGVEKCGTAYAYHETYSTCFMTIPKKIDGTGKTFGNWGWTNGPLPEGDYVFDLWWGAADCDLDKGTLIGNVTVSYHGGTAIVTFNTSGSGFWMDTTHVYAGNSILPEKNATQYTVSPGQYGSTHDLADVTTDTHTIGGLSGEIYVIAHAVGCHWVFD